MNMKSLIALTALTAAGAASAEVTSGNTLCRIEVNSGTKSTIVAVPLVKIGDTPANIPVTELVLTDNLAEDDTILHWNGTSWDAWEIAVEEGTGAKSWEPTKISEGLKNCSASAPAENTALARGDAIWVNRADTEKPFYVYGQVTTDAATATTLVRGTAEQPVYTMVGNPLTTDKAVSALTFTGSPAAGDSIMWGDSSAIGGLKELTWNGTQWGYFVATKETLKNGRTVNKKEWTASTDTIPAGQGFWYVSRSGEGTLTVAW